MLCSIVLVGAAPAFAQGSRGAEQPTISVTGVGRVFVAPDQAIVSLGATIQRDDAQDAQRELDAVMRATVRAIQALGVAAESLKTVSLSLMPVYAEPDVAAAGAARRRDEPEIVAYRATSIVQVTIDELASVGSIVDAGIGAGSNEIRDISFELANDLPYRVAALERAVDAAQQKARAAANALGVRLAGPVEVREQSVAIPFRRVDTAFARAEVATPIEPGEITIEATVDATFGLDGLRSAAD